MKKLVLQIFLFFACMAFVYAQTATISGVVKDAETGETLPYCSYFVIT